MAKGFRTLEDFAKSIGYDRSHYSRMVGEGRFSKKAHLKTATALGLNPHELLQIMEGEDEIGVDNLPFDPPTVVYTTRDASRDFAGKTEDEIEDQIEEMIFEVARLLRQRRRLRKAKQPK